MQTWSYIPVLSMINDFELHDLDSILCVSTGCQTPPKLTLCKTCSTPGTSPTCVRQPLSSDNHCQCPWCHCSFAPKKSYHRHNADYSDHELSDDGVCTYCYRDCGWQLQAEPRSALNLASREASPLLRLNPTDLLLYSAKIIPGNDNKVMNMMNNASQLGVEIAMGPTEGLHTSGHAYRWALRWHTKCTHSALSAATVFSHGVN